MSDENKVISLGGEVDNNAPAVEEKESEAKTTEVLATPFETPAEAYIPTPTEVQKVVDKKPEQTKKKRNKVLKGIIITLVVLILLVVLATGVLFFLIVYDDMPSAPADVPSTSEIVTSTITDFMTDDGRMEFSTLEVNGIYKKIEPALKEAISSYGAELNESFIVLSDNKATYYARVNYKGITLPVRISIFINYEDPYITVTLDKAKIGQFTIPEKLISTVLTKVELPQDITFDANNSKFSYDTTALNDIFIGFIRKNDFVSDIESFLNWGAGIFGGEYSYEDTFNITISECQVMENQLVFKIGSIFE